jgi:galactonate dehydratase
MGRDPFDVEAIVGTLIRDQYQGGPTVMTAISALEVALWDIIGKSCGQPIYRLIGGRCHTKVLAYANGWYGGAITPNDYADRAREVASRGYRALKFDPFGTAWKDLDPTEVDRVVEIVAAVREAIGPNMGMIVEFHGRLSAPSASAMLRRLEPFDPQGVRNR